MLLNDFFPPNYSKDDNGFFDKDGIIFTKVFALVIKRRSQNNKWQILKKKYN